jgi:hypothetical protein
VKKKIVPFQGIHSFSACSAKKSGKAAHLGIIEFQVFKKQLVKNCCRFWGARAPVMQSADARSEEAMGTYSRIFLYANEK